MDDYRGRKIFYPKRWATLGNAGVLIACCLPSVRQTLAQRDSSAL